MMEAGIEERATAVPHDLRAVLDSRLAELATLDEAAEPGLAPSLAFGYVKFSCISGL